MNPYDYPSNIPANDIPTRTVDQAVIELHAAISELDGNLSEMGIEMSRVLKPHEGLSDPISPRRPTSPLADELDSAIRKIESLNRVVVDMRGRLDVPRASDTVAVSVKAGTGWPIVDGGRFA